MKKLSLLNLLILFLGASAFSQDAKPAASENDNDVVKISTALIQIDVSVTDRKGKIVTDLRRDEIEIYENGKKQDISNFLFISDVRELPEERKKGEKPSLNLPPPTRLRPEQVARTIALVVDDLTLSFESTYYVRRALKKFVDDQMQPRDLVAIIRTGAGVGALQQFTTDKRQLYAAIEKVRWNPSGTGQIGAFAPLQAKIDTGEPEQTPGRGERTPEGIEREFNEFRNSVFATGTLGAVNYIVRGMANLPGRKSIMMLSDGFKLFPKDALGFRESGRVVESVRRLVDQANRASVVIYTMDPRGLQTLGLTAADNTGGRSVEEIQQSVSERRDELEETQDGLVFLARETGGFAIINNNDLSGGIRRILNDQSYYLIGYQPDDQTFDPKTRKFNKLDVRITRPGTRVRYRSGFFAVSDEKIEKPALNGSERLIDALTSPFAVNDIALSLNTVFLNHSKTGSYLRSLVHVNAGDLTFSDDADGAKKAMFDILAVGFGDNGIPVDRISKAYTITLKKDLYDRFLREGFVYDFTFPIKKPGAYQLRIALRDHGSEKVGSANQFIEVPNLKKNRLTLGGLALENVAFEVWQKRNAGNPTPSANEPASNPLIDTSLRRFKNGTVLNYGFVAYNAKTGTSRRPELILQTRVFSNGQPIFEGKPQPVSFEGQSDPKAINIGSSLNLGNAMKSGDYLLQIIVTDTLAKEKYRTASQFIQFEIID